MENVSTPGHFAAWFAEVLSMVRELDARRKFDTEVSEWLKETDRVKDFEAWRKLKSDAAETPKDP